MPRITKAMLEKEITILQRMLKIERDKTDLLTKEVNLLKAHPQNVTSPIIIAHERVTSDLSNVIHDLKAIIERGLYVDKKV